jgi:hypothetical protein
VNSDFIYSNLRANARMNPLGHSHPPPPNDIIIMDLNLHFVPKNSNVYAVSPFQCSAPFVLNEGVHNGTVSA